MAETRARRGQTTTVELVDFFLGDRWAGAVRVRTRSQETLRIFPRLLLVSLSVSRLAHYLPANLPSHSSVFSRKSGYFVTLTDREDEDGIWPPVGKRTGREWWVENILEP